MCIYTYCIVFTPSIVHIFSHPLCQLLLSDAMLYVFAGKSAGLFICDIPWLFFLNYAYMNIHIWTKSWQIDTCEYDLASGTRGLVVAEFVFVVVVETEVCESTACNLW